MRTRFCSIDGCGRTAWARGWCSKHLQRFYKHGDPLVVMERTAPPFLPNPWADEAPPCPHCGEVAYFWAAGPLCWVCPPCRRRFDVAVEAAA